MHDLLRRSFLQFMAWLLLSGFGVSFAIWQGQMAERIETQPVKQLKEKTIQRLWFTPQGQLMALRREGTIMFVLQVGTAPDARLEEKPVILPSDKSDLPFAISPDGSQAAFAYREKVTLQPVFGATAFRERELEETPKRLVLTGTGLLIALSRDGELTVFDTKDLQKRASQKTKVTDADFLEANSSFITAASKREPRAQVFDTRTLPKIQIVEEREFLDPFLSITLSPAGRIAVGTEVGPLLAERPMNTPGAVTALCFFDEHHIAAAGTFEGILLLPPAAGSRELIHTPHGTFALAANATHLAFASPQGLTLMSHHTVPAVTANGMKMFWLWLIATSVILAALLTRFVLQLMEELKNRSKGQKRLGSGKKRPGWKPLEDFEPGEDLIDALQHKLCILAAGEELSASCGYPEWCAFLVTLVDWLADLQSITVRQQNALRVSGDKGESAVIFAAMKDRPDLLNDYARTIYTRPAALSTVHENLATVPFAGFITANLDSLIERTFAHLRPPVFAPTEIGLMRAEFDRNQVFLLKQRGLWERPGTIRLAAPGKHAGDEDPVTEFMATALTTRTLVFVGANLDELDNWTEGLRPQAVRRHYVLLGINEKTSKRVADSLASRFQMQVLTYPAGDTKQVVAFLEKLSKIATVKQSAAVKV